MRWPTGLTIIHKYCDRAQTGRNDNWEQFQLMLADTAKHAFDALIVWKTDRMISQATLCVQVFGHHLEH